MRIAQAHQLAFKTVMRLRGQTIIVHEHFNTPETTSYEVKGFKNTEGKNSRRVIFQFPEALDIPVGAVLQVKGSRDYWLIIDTEDIVEENTFINFVARVVKINLAGQSFWANAANALLHPNPMSAVEHFYFTEDLNSLKTEDIVERKEIDPEQIP